MLTPSPAHSEDVLTRPWGDLVFHVLAHVDPSSRCAASVYDPTYVAFAARHLGEAGSRLLGEDAVLLARMAPDHASLARAQLLAWLFRDLQGAEATAGLELGELRPEQVYLPGVLLALKQAPAAAEYLRCAALLERPAWEALPPVRFDPAEAQCAVRSLSAVAPALASCRIAFVRSLRCRGRVVRQEIWVGVPGQAPGPSLSHVGWQAAHEATVLEAEDRARQTGEPLEHARLEHAAVVLLAERARAAGRITEHLAWYSHLGAGAPELSPLSLDPGSARVVESCLANPWARAGAPDEDRGDPSGM